MIETIFNFPPFNFFVDDFDKLFNEHPQIIKAAAITAAFIIYHYLTKIPKASA